MAIPTTLMIHTCSIAHQAPTGSVDAAGVPAVTTTTQTGVACRFVAPKRMTQILESGEHVVSLPGVLLAAGVSVYEGDTITSTDTGFAKTYVVQAVKAVYGPTAISHQKCDLEAVT